uniref:MIP08027p n=1 Tax=Drosophila melanogaster TaxID=7227 RepID=D5SHS9_DROME|nr:MIP08027p [Drosophila melanogaster]
MIHVWSLCRLPPCVFFVYIFTPTICMHPILLVNVSLYIDPWVLPDHLSIGDSDPEIAVGFMIATICVESNQICNCIMHLFFYVYLGF